MTGASPGVIVATTSWDAASARVPTRHPSSSASARATSSRTSAHTPGPYPAAFRHRAAQAPFTPHPTIPTVAAPRGARTCAETAAAAPVRSHVTARQSMIARSSPVVASESTTAPATTGSPRSGLCGNEVTHFRSANPSPRAGIARKSP